MENSKRQIGICGLSDPVSLQKQNEVINWLNNLGLDVIVSQYMDSKSTPNQKAKELNAWFSTNAFSYIFDISGGDQANLCLPYIDYKTYARCDTVFVGYSDLSTVCNALWHKAQKPTLLFQIRNHEREKEVIDFLQQHSSALTTLDLKISDIVVGGNLRCFLKLAGTPYLPDVSGCILFLEAYAGSKERILSYLNQCVQMGLFHEAKAVIFGQFTQLDQEGNRDVLKDFSKQLKIPVFYTQDIGHSKDSKALWIGKKK